MLVDSLLFRSGPLDTVSMYRGPPVSPPRLAAGPSRDVLAGTRWPRGADRNRCFIPRSMIASSPPAERRSASSVRTPSAIRGMRCGAR